MRDLSIIIGVKDRSRSMCSRRPLTLFPRCMDSIIRAQQALPTIMFEVVIVDWSSTDWPLHEWVYVMCGTFLPIEIVTVNQPGFLRGRARNIGARRANSDMLFFLDADMLLGADGLRTCYEAARQGKAVFPICRTFNDQDHTIVGGWGHSTGNVCLSRETWLKAGQWREWKFWGPEDWYFHDACQKVTTVVRPDTPDIIHQWHPDSWRGEVRKYKNYVPPPGEEGAPGEGTCDHRAGIGGPEAGG